MSADVYGLVTQPHDKYSIEPRNLRLPEASQYSSTEQPLPLDSIRFLCCDPHRDKLAVPLLFFPSPFAPRPINCNWVLFFFFFAHFRSLLFLLNVCSFPLMFDSYCQRWPGANGFILVENVGRFMEIIGGDWIASQHFYNRFGHVNLIEFHESTVCPIVDFLCPCLLARQKRGA